MKSDKITHKKMFRYICENLDEEIDSAKCREIRKHIEGCTDCEAYLESLKTTIALYRHYPIPPLTPKAKKRLQSIIRSRG